MHLPHVHHDQITVAAKNGPPTAPPADRLADRPLNCAPGQDPVIPVPTAEQVAAAEEVLEVRDRRCGRCAVLFLNPHPNMYQRQVVAHADRHAELEALDDRELGLRYDLSTIVISEWDNAISSTELRRRGIDPLTVPRLRFQCWA